MVAASKARKIPQVNKRRTKGPTSPAFRKHFCGVPHLQRVLTFVQRCFFGVDPSVWMFLQLRPSFGEIIMNRFSINEVIIVSHIVIRAGTLF